jgi:type VI secretion system protein ImpF
MARLKAAQPLVPSVLDRLLDNEPDVSREAPRSNHQVLADLKLSLRRDLENLLNTRARCLQLPSDLTELNESLVNYGIPDITGQDLGQEKVRQKFCRELEEILRKYEPRFQSVKVEMLATDTLDRTLRFRIDGMIYADPAPEPVIFDSAMKAVSGTFEVKGVG